MTDELINETTYSNITRLVLGASCRILKMLIKNHADHDAIKTLTIKLCTEVEAKMTKILVETKRKLLNSDTVELSHRELCLVRSAIGFVGTVVTCLIGSTVYKMKAFVSQFMGSVQDPEEEEEEGDISTSTSHALAIQMVRESHQL